MTHRATRAARSEGRDAVIAARLRAAGLSRAQPDAIENPYRYGTQRARFFNWGVEQADRLIDRLMEI